MFTLGSDNPTDGTETSAIFAGTSSDVKVQRKPKNLRKSTSAKKFNRFDYLKEKAQELGVSDKEKDEEKDDSDDERVTRIKELAKLLSQRISTRAETIAAEESVSRNVEKNVVPGSDEVHLVSEESKSDLKCTKSSSSKISGNNKVTLDYHSCFNQRLGFEYCNVVGQNIPLVDDLKHLIICYICDYGVCYIHVQD